MTNYRILNRIVLINIANVKYADVELSGNTCFVGTNNYGKTSLQRAILFFYSANSRGLGISSSQKPFEEHYFRYENSFLVYEVATDEGNFCIIAYRHNKLNFRFVDSPYNPDFFFNENDEAHKIGEVLKKLEKAGVQFSNQIDTFERYRNVVFGTETDRFLSKFYLLRGNEKYQNIPKSITNVFLSSKSSIDSRFIKDFIANSLNTENASIRLEQVERQLRQFNDKYTDIETFLKKDTQHLIELIDKKFDQVRMLKTAQIELSEKLGSTVKYSEKRNDELIREVNISKETLEQSESDHELLKQQIEDKQKDIREEIGYYDRTIRESNKKLKEYQNKSIDLALEKFNQREQIQVELNMARKEYEALTSNVLNLELKFTSLIENLQNERNAYINRMNGKMTDVVNHYSEAQLLLKNEFNKKDTELKEKKDKLLGEIIAEITAKQIEFNSLKSDERVIKSTRYYEDEIRTLDQELAELRAVTYKNRSEKAIKSNMIQTLQKEWENAEGKLKLSLSNQINQTNIDIIAKKESIKNIDLKLHAQADAFYGYLEKNVKDWQNTIGKVCSEDILFRTDLNPQVLGELHDTLYGVSLELGNVGISSKSIGEYQSEKNAILAEIRTMEESLNQFQVANNEEKMLIADRFGKQIGEMKEELKVLNYSLELAEKREKKLMNELEDWKEKSGKEIESGLSGNRQKLNLVEEELSLLNKKKNILQNDIAEQFDKIKAYHDERLEDLKERQEKEIAELEKERAKTLSEFDKKDKELGGDKETSYKSKGVDSKQLKNTDKKIKDLQDLLREIDQYVPLVNDYLKDKREFFDRLPDLVQKKDEFVKQANELVEQLEEANRKFNLKTMELRKEKREKESLLIELNTGINHFLNHFKGTPTFQKHEEIINAAPPMQTNYSVMDLCTQLFKNDSHFNLEYGEFQRYVNEFAGKFKLENHFNFVIRSDASQSEYERFAQYLTNFVHENKIELSIAETATQISLVTDSIATKVKELSNQQDKIQHIISLIAEDFKKAEFEESKLIEFIKIKLEESDNKVYKLLKKIEEFKEEHGAFYAEGLFNTDYATGKNKEINTKAVRLLDNLRQAIKEQQQEEIRLQDLFELKFNIKEGVNETGWTHKIDSIGSTGTDILVKAIIYITLLHVFIKESSHRSSKEFKVHCIIDEVGQISAHYLRELLRFARNRNIMMINGLPNKSGLESHYRYTYQFRKEDTGNVRIFPSIVTEVEA